VVRHIEAEDVDGAIVRVLISLPASVDRSLDERAIREATSGAEFVASISKDIVEHRRTRLADAYSRSLSPEDALRMYLETRQATVERVETLVSRAREMIARREGN
jgi:metal-responsive CopG/Arc/MetJ family transcriptional regulator